MMWRPWSRFSSMLVLGLLSGVAVWPVQAADPVDVVPDSASVVVRWKTPKATLAKFADYVDAVQPGFGGVVNGSLPGLGQAIAVPNLEAVDVDKDWWIIVFAEPQAVPAVVFVIPTTDVKAVEEALPDDFEFHAEGNLAIYSSDEDAVQAVRERLSGKAKGLWPAIDDASKKLFNASDFSALVNVQQLAKDFDDDLEQAEPRFNELVDQITSIVPDAQRPQMAAVFEFYRTIGKGILQGIRDSNSLTVGIAISKEVIRFEDRLQVNAGTETSKVFGSQPTGDLSLMSRLPAGKASYIGTQFEMSGMIEWSMKFSKEMLTNVTDAQKTDFDTAVKQMKGLKYGEMALYIDIDSTTKGALRTGSVTEVTPTDRMREITRTIQKSMSKVEAAGFTQTTKLEPAAEKIGGVEVDRITIKQEFDANADQMEIQKKIQTTLFGDQGMQILAMYQPKRVLQTMGGGTREMMQLSTALNSTNSKDSAVVATARKRFVDKANAVALVDLARMIVNGVTIAAQQQVIPVDASAFADLKLAPSFIGFSLALESSAAKSEFEIPVEQAQGIAKIVSLFMNLRR